MLNFFPTLYEDELLLSAICRYRYRCGFRNIRSLEMSIYNRKQVTKSAYLPMKIDEFVKRLPPTSELTSGEIIRKHTLFPFFTAYLSDERTNQIFEAMERGSKVSVERMLAFPSVTVKLTNFLRYCPLCYEEDIELYGESYWRRLYQLPGVLYCPKHEVLIKDSLVTIVDGVTNYVIATEACNNTIEKDVNPSRVKKLNLEYVDLANKLLNNNWSRKSLPFINSFYIDRLREFGFTSKNGYINSKKLMSSFIEYFTPTYLELMQSPVDMQHENNWLRRFVAKNGRNRSPLRHLLLHQFLKMDVDKLFTTKSVVGRLKTNNEIYSPIFDVNERRKKWLKIIRGNPEANRYELARIGKGLHTWLRRHDLEWYEEVTPKGRKCKNKKQQIDYVKRDNEILNKVKEGHKRLLAKKGKPVRITPDAIRREIGANRWITDKRLVNTNQYLKMVKEEINDYRRRKIKWAINEMTEKGQRITLYKVQIYAGFGGGADEEVRKLIIEELAKMNTGI